MYKDHFTILISDIKPNLSQLHPFSFTSMKPIAHKDYRDLHLKIWVSLLIVVVLILVVDVCGPNYVYRGKQFLH